MRGVPDNAFHRQVEGHHGDVFDVRVSRANPGLVRAASVEGINGGVWLDLERAQEAVDALQEAIIAARTQIEDGDA
jgi:hypothetical protein